ncbi:multidrug ABC transporter ATPase/permease [Staphylococcus piscifermentans]|uniref:ABC transporter ATP-binding protein n=1 Tax=Staphylococcus piscifermentans TaxID=70258 RepID=A0A239TJ97_9STAP|nr:ABC transporter ATP-binding protein [Staphylococcus piscifermentans]GEP84489.1 ABC transporter ATP-binding protein [Staphylococcus piscifermentans]SNU97941.1 multidrug ABC transporter ATPase/permease [Staphylococcus piscifermentans]
MNNIKTLYRYMGGYKKYILLSLIFSALSVVAMLIPYYSIYKMLMNIVNNEEIEAVKYGLLASSAIIIGVIIYFISLYLSHISAFGVERNIRNYGIDKLMNIELAFFDDNQSGTIRKTIDDNAAKTHVFIAHNLPDLVGILISPIIILTFLFTINWVMGLIMLVMILVALFLIYLMVGKVNNMKKFLNSLNQMISDGTEYIRGIQVIKIFNASFKRFLNFKKSVGDYSRWATNYAFSARVPYVFNQILLHGISILILLVTLPFIEHSPDFNQFYVSIIFTILISGQIVLFLSKIMNTGENVSLAIQIVGEVENIFSNYNFNQFNERLNKKIEGNIEVKDLSFTYDSDKYALKDINFSIPAKSIVAIVGSSGSGKSTIAKVLSKMYGNYEGSIKIGDRELKDINEVDYMNYMTYVFQGMKLYNLSIYDNLKLANENITDKDIEKAMQKAQCQDIVEKLPEGLNTVIGGQHVKLSGGEIQRLVLCRALLRDTEFLIVDEVTASIDPVNEYKIQCILEELVKEKTVVIISHKLNLVKMAQQVLVMNQGNITQKGSHQELLLEDGMYKTMFERYRQTKTWKLGES